MEKSSMMPHEARPMHRVLVTGMGTVSSLGKSVSGVLNSLLLSRSGIVAMPEMQELGLRCDVIAPVKEWSPDGLRKQSKKSMSSVAQFAVMAAQEAIADAGFDIDELRDMPVSVIFGSAFSGISQVFPAEQWLVKHHKPSRAGVTPIAKIINSSAAGHISAYFGLHGRSYSLCSSFATGSDCIGYAAELIHTGRADMCLCGAAEELTWKQAGVSFDNFGGLVRNWNGPPEAACRPYDRDRTGFVISEGAGVLFLESLSSARRRGAQPYAEIVGFGSASDGADMYRPNGDGLERAIQQALSQARERGSDKVDYINSHGTGTSLGDSTEVAVLRSIFGENVPPLSSTKGLGGHGLGAAGALEAIHVLLMLQNDFMAPTANLENVAPECSGVPHLQTVENKEISSVMTFNVGLGGANSCLVFSKCSNDYN